MPAPKSILNLIERFENNILSYKSGDYNETQVRLEFINPLFEELGWDVSNRAGYAEAYKDVIHEFSQKTSDVVEAPDYLFRIGGMPKFFVEAKRPKVNLKDDIHPAYQLRRYAWSAKLPLSVLTDFEEFVVYDCRVQPKQNDKSSVARINYYNYKDYIDKWDELSNIFSKDAVLKGSFDKFATGTKGKRGTAEVDDAFLKEIEKWRDLLAHNIALRNGQLSNRELNFAVQKTIDRIIFLRICEDRGIEEYGQLLALQNGENIYKRLLQLFQRADEKFNSGLFHFEKEKNRNGYPDELTPALSLDDKVLKGIFKNLYYPDSPYEFSVLPADLLGHVYEQFLGKVIRLTPGHQAKIEDKPEVKKAGGVYYTPTYIVDYIVKNTVGKLLEGKTPKQAAKLTILDPACGSGSFLLGAYQFLLDWHLQYYVDNIDDSLKAKQPVIYQTGDLEYKLTTTERKRILLNNIYGVDIDSQAVEVTKLSLLLKVLEGETEQSLNSQIKMFRERALPDLANNIKCGNSLIGPDFYSQTELQLDDDERMRINVFDWNTEFKNIMDDGGFDAVIGNPPYGATLSRNEIPFIKSNYGTGFTELDTYQIFIERSFTLCNDKALIGMIIPDTWLTLINGENFRRNILNSCSISEFTGLNESVFRNATVDPLIIILENKKPVKNHIVKIYTCDKKIKLNDLRSLVMSSERVQSDLLIQKRAQINIFLNDEFVTIINKLKFGRVTLENIIDYRAGCKPYEKGKGKPPQSKKTLDEKPYTSFVKIKNWAILIRGNDVQRYYIEIKKPEWIKYGEWLAAPREKIIFENPRIVIQAIRNPSLLIRIVASYTEEKYISRINVYSLLLKKDVKISYYFLLGILNSKLMNWFVRKEYGLHTYVITGVLQIPVNTDYSTHQKEQYDKIEDLVKLIISLNEKRLLTKLADDLNTIKRQIIATDREIDRLVYELYGLTEEEIKIVESS